MAINEVQDILRQLEELGIRDFDLDFVFEEEDDVISTSFNIFSIDEFEDGQLGYRVGDKGNSLIGADWKDSWYVIGYDELGDPIFVDINNKNYPVLTLEHDGDWEPTILFDSIMDLIKTVKNK